MTAFSSRIRVWAETTFGVVGGLIIWVGLAALQAWGVVVTALAIAHIADVRQDWWWPVFAAAAVLALAPLALLPVVVLGTAYVLLLL